MVLRIFAITSTRAVDRMALKRHCASGVLMDFSPRPNWPDALVQIDLDIQRFKLGLDPLCHIYLDWKVFERHTISFFGVWQDWAEIVCDGELQRQTNPSFICIFTTHSRILATIERLVKRQVNVSDLLFGKVQQGLIPSQKNSHG